MRRLFVSRRHRLIPALGLCLLNVGTLAQAPTKPSPPALYQPRTPQVDLRHVALNLRFDWSRQQAYGTAAVTVAPLRALDSLTLDAVQLTIEGASLLDGTPLRYAYDGDRPQDNLRIALGNTQRPGDTLSVVVRYRTRWVNATDPANIGGSTGKGLRFFAPSSTEPNRRRQLWSMGEPEGNRCWFPGVDAPGDLRTTEFTATVEKPLVVVANGVLTGTTDHPDGTRTFRYRADVPHPNHKTAFVVGEYVDVVNTHGPIPLHNHAYPDEAEATRATVERLPDMVRFFADLTGQPYPFPAYAQAFVQELPWGYASSGLSVQTENMVDDHPTHADYLYLWDMLEGESLAGQWFGNYLSCRDWRHGWLDKAFSRYLSCLFNEHKNGKEEFLLYQLTFDQGNYFNDWNGGNRHPVVTDRVGDATAFLSENYPNSRGALVLHQLRKHLGEDAWRKALRHYVRANEGQPVTTADFERAVERATGENLGWFFDQWVYKMGHPVFEVSKRYDPAAKRLTLIVRQVQQPDSGSVYPQVAFFKGNLDVEIDGRIERVWVEPKAENTFAFACPTEPKLVHFDYESAWIKELRFKKPLDELLHQVQHDRDVLGKRWAMNELAGLSAEKTTSDADRQKIVAALQNLIGSNGYWRIRFNAIGALQNLLTAGANGNPLTLDGPTRETLLAVVQRDSAWVRAAALTCLGLTRDGRFADLYLVYLNDKSERVVNAAAIALGRSKSPLAFEALVRLKDKPSWKNQSLISSLNGLRELGDPRAVAFALPFVNASHLPHWTLATPLWDHRLAALQTLVALGAAGHAYPVVFKDFTRAVRENNTNDVFYHLLQLTTLADERGREAFDLLKQQYGNDPATLAVVRDLEGQFTASLKPSK